MDLLKKIIEFVMDILETVVFVGSLFIVAYLFIAAPNAVRGASMEPTFDNGDYIITSKVAYKFGEPQQGDVIVFASLKNQDIDFIKRIIALPGDRVSINDGSVYVNGTQLDETYTSGPTYAFENGFVQDGIDVVVPEGELFVLGDNRSRSSDSREFGFVPRQNIIGKVIYRYFPADKMGTIDNPYHTYYLVVSPFES